MGRPQKHTDHPLYKLRRLLGEQSPVTQVELSQILEIPLATLQSIECGRRARRGLSSEIEEKISQMIWAVWDKEKSCWMFKHSHPPEKFSYQLWHRYRQFIFEKAAIPKTDSEAIKMRVDALFRCVPKESWMKVYWQLQDCLEKCREDLGIKEVELLFRAARDEIHFDPAITKYIGKEGKEVGSYTAKPLYRMYRPQREPREKELRDYLREYYKQCAEYYLELSKSPLKTDQLSSDWTSRWDLKNSSTVARSNVAHIPRKSPSGHGP